MLISDHKEIEKAVITIILGDLDQANEDGNLPPAETSEWAQCATALALHRLANAWERRVEIEEAIARQKGINP